MNLTHRKPHVSFVLATHNRREVAARTIGRLHECGLEGDDFETIVVDNASEDGTADALEPHVDRLVRLGRNAGSCAKAYGVPYAAGQFVVFLDDDSYPLPGSVARMIGRFHEAPNLGAAGFTVHLPDGGLEGGALPGVFVGCGVGLRAAALRDCGGLDATLFMQAEEYDLAFRLAVGGWDVDVFDDLHVEHLKSRLARRSERTTYLDTRNNLIVAARYLPDGPYAVYRADWAQRYGRLARLDGHVREFRRGRLAGWWRGMRERQRLRGQRLSGPTFERFFGWSHIERSMRDLACAGVRRVIFAGLGKNVYAYYRATRRTGVAVSCVGHDGFARYGGTYRGVPLVPLDGAVRADGDAVIIADSSPVHGAALAERVAAGTQRPVVHWCFGRSVGAAVKNRLPHTRLNSDQSGRTIEPAVVA